MGRLLLNAFQAIEAANPERLQGVFGNAAWTDKAQVPDETLKKLIEHFSKHALSLGNGYEYLIKQFADDCGHTAQEFYTNRTLVHLMAQMLESKAGESIYDPTCGTAGMLISCLAAVTDSIRDEIVTCMGVCILLWGLKFLSVEAWSGRGDPEAPRS